MQNITRRVERREISRLINGLDHLAYGANFGGGKYSFGSTRDFQAIIRAVFLGQVEDKPFNLAALSAMVEIPRATLERKLSSLEAAGLLERKGRRWCICLKKLNNPDMLLAVDKMVLMIHKASQNLRNAQSGHE